MIPAQFEEVKTDVETPMKFKKSGNGDIIAAAVQKHRPLVGGIQIQNKNMSNMGTLGCFATTIRKDEEHPEKTVLLSCYHVLYDGDVKPDDGVGQPTYDEGSQSSCGSCSRESSVVASIENGADGGLVDCAIAALEHGIGFENKIMEIGDVSSTGEVFLCEVVVKTGAAGGLTHGIVKDTNAVIDSGDGYYLEQIMIVRCLEVFDGVKTEWEEWPSLRFSEDGDSGAAVILVEEEGSKKDTVVGLGRTDIQQEFFGI